MNKLRHRYIFDIILSALLIVEMFFELTGDVLHEILGCVFFVTIILHLVLSRKWMTVTAKQMACGKRLKFANKLRLAFAVGLAVSFIALVASSIAISLQLIQITGVNIAGSARETWVVIHTVSSYALCAFTIAHVLTHWASIFSVFKIPYNPARRQAINTGATALVAVSAVALGVAGSKAVEEIVNPQLPQQESNETPIAEAAPTTPEPSTPKPTAPEPTTPEPSTPEPKQNAESSVTSEPTQSSPSTSSPSTPAPESPAPSQQESSSSATGYCTLCKKRCPLSAPQCNKPYQAGLL